MTYLDRQYSTLSSPDYTNPRNRVAPILQPLLPKSSRQIATRLIHPFQCPSQDRILAGMIQVQSRVLGKLLLANQSISDVELSAALQEQRETRERLGEVLIRRGTDAELIARALAQQLRLEYAEPPLQPEPAALKLVKRSLA